MLLVQLVLFLGCIVCVAVILAPDVALLLTVIPSQQAAAGPWIDGALLGFWFSRTGLQLRVLTHLFLSYAFLRPVAAILWLLDEWLYPEYRQVEIKAPIKNYFFRTVYQKGQEQHRFTEPLLSTKTSS
jgi:hypothetical protein